MAVGHPRLKICLSHPNQLAFLAMVRRRPASLLLAACCPLAFLAPGGNLGRLGCLREFGQKRCLPDFEAVSKTALVFELVLQARRREACHGAKRWVLQM